MAGWDWPAKLNRMQLEHLLILDFLGSCTNVILVGSTGIGKTHLATALGHTACLAGYSLLLAAAIDVVNRLSLGAINLLPGDYQLRRVSWSLSRPFRCWRILVVEWRALRMTPWRWLLFVVVC